MKLALIGFGTVGQGFAEILRDKANHLRDKQGFEASIVAVATRSRGTLYHPEGLSIDELLAAIETGHLRNYPDTPGLIRDWDTPQIIRESNADAILEATHSNLLTGQPAIDYCRAAFDTGKHVVLANKGPAALAYQELREHAARAGKYLRCEGTVMAGTPAIQVARESLGGCQITGVRGILNGTTNYILSQMETGMSYNEALAQAQALGYAEADPTADVSGTDAAGKIIILFAILFGVKCKLGDLYIEGIDKITQADIESAREANERWKLIAEISNGRGHVRPIRLPLSDPLASVSGATNAITFETDVMGNITVIGPGAGRQQTGYALLLDLLAIHRYGD